MTPPPPEAPLAHHLYYLMVDWVPQNLNPSHFGISTPIHSTQPRFLNVFPPPQTWTLGSTRRSGHMGAWDPSHLGRGGARHVSTVPSSLFSYTKIIQSPGKTPFLCRVLCTFMLSSDLTYTAFNRASSSITQNERTVSWNISNYLIYYNIFISGSRAPIGFFPSATRKFWFIPEPQTTFSFHFHHM